MLYPKLISLVALSLLTGCIATYAPPQGTANAARLRIGQTSRGVQTLVLAAPEGCLGAHNSDSFGQKIAILEGSIKHLQTQARPLLGMPLSTVGSGDKVETTLLPGKPFSLAINFTAAFGSNALLASETYCMVGLKFTPDAGTDYEAMLHIKDRRCSIVLTKLMPSLPSPSRVPVASEPLKACTK